MEELLQKWYTNNHPEDELGEIINPKATFKDLFEYLDSYKDVYLLLDVGDSIIRERLFKRLSELIDMPYSYIYEQWLKSV